MTRTELTANEDLVLKSARRMATTLEVDSVLMLSERSYDFAEIQKRLKGMTLVVAADKPDVHAAATEDGIQLIPLFHEPLSRSSQLERAVLEGIADEFFQSGEQIVAVYSSFEKEHLDTISLISLKEHLTRLTSRDLQRLETQVPLETLRQVVDLAVEIGREGREGKPVGTLFVVGDHKKVLELSHEQVFNSFKGYPRKECALRYSKVRESIKELAQIDGAFIVSADGHVEANGRILNVAGEDLVLSPGLGSRHWAAAAISKATNAIAVAVSESTGTVRIFQNGTVMLRIEPMARAMKWLDEEGLEGVAKES